MNLGLEKKHVREILKNGFTVINGLISKQECENIKKISKKIFIKYNKLTKIKNPLEQTIYNLHNKHPIFIKYINYKKTIKIVQKVLSSGSYKNSGEIILRQTAMRNPLKGHAQQLHNDTRVVGCKFPLVLHIIYMIDDFTINNGSTRIVPKSHIKTKYAENNKVYNNEKTIKGKKGSAVLFDASLWHGSSTKKNDDERWGMIYSYSRWFLKPDFDYNKNTPMKVYKKLTKVQKALLGFNFNPRKDEFSRPSARSIKPDLPIKYSLPI